ncbi:MAG: FCD domain-containing protein [Lachnospiraceae bacterium]|nr:FCD domain-containing protein [Lachnospiraceae bacterium]
MDIIPQSGTFVRLLNLDHLKQALFIREAVEQETFYEIITNVIKMKKNLERQKKIFELSNDFSRFFQANDEFHICQLEAIGKKEAMSMLKDAHMHTQRWRKIGFDMINQIDSQIADHEAILKAIETEDWRMGRDAIHKHISFLIQFSEKIMAKYPKYFA